MSELVERYVHQVGRYLPKKERADIEAELRSLIQDQLDDRFQESPTEADIASVLTEFGDPHQMATSYNREQYLVGPDLYPFMMMVLRHVWVIIPAIVIFLNIFSALVSPPQRTLLALLIETVIATVQATLIFSAIVVLFFALIQQSFLKIEADEDTFNPLNLPQVDDPSVVDRVEGAFGLAIGTIMIIVLFYWLSVGGLTLRFNLSDPGEVIPVSVFWTLLLLIAVAGQVILELMVLRRNHWSVAWWLTQAVLELVGVFGLYFVVLKPVVEHFTVNPALTNLPEIIAIIFAIIIVLGKGTKLIRLWGYRSKSLPPLPVKTDG